MERINNIKINSIAAIVFRKGIVTLVNNSDYVSFPVEQKKNKEILATITKSKRDQFRTKSLVTYCKLLREPWSEFPRISCCFGHIPALTRSHSVVDFATEVCYTFVIYLVQKDFKENNL